MFSTYSSYLVGGEQLAPPLGLGQVVDGEAQVVVAVFKQENVRLVDEATSKLSLRLHHLLQRRHHSGVSGTVRHNTRSCFLNAEDP